MERVNVHFTKISLPDFILYKFWKSNILHVFLAKCVVRTHVFSEFGKYRPIIRV